MFSKYPISLVLRTLSLLSSLLFLSACSSFLEAPDSENYIFLEPEETLYVRFSVASDLRIEQAMPEVADSMKKKRIRDYEAVMRELLQVYRFPMDVYLLDEFESPGDGPVLDLHAMRWWVDDYGELRLFLKSRLERYGELNTLGTFSVQETITPMMGNTRVDELFQATMRKGLTQMFTVLMDHFQFPEEDVFVPPPNEDAAE